MSAHVHDLGRQQHHPTPEHDAQVRETIERVRSGEDLRSPRPDFDAKQAREFRREATRGQTDEKFRTALERHGFRFYAPAACLERGWTLGATEGLWRHPAERYRMAFTPSDLPGMFAGGPEEFDRWVRQHKAARDMAAARAKGLITVAEAKRHLDEIGRPPR